MEEIIVKKQRQMTFAETLDFCLSSIRHRFMRSILTLSVVILAVAFFMFLQCSNIFKNSVKSNVEQEILESRKASRILSLLYTTKSPRNFASMLLAARKSEGDFERIRKMLKIDKADMQYFVDSAANEMVYLRFFDNLPFGKRKELFKQFEDAKAGGNNPEATLQADVVFEELYKDIKLQEAKKEVSLEDVGKFGTFKEDLRELGIKLPGSTTDFFNFVKDYNKYKIELDKAYLTLDNLRKDARFPMKDDEGKSLEDRRTLAAYLLKLHNEKRLDSEWCKKLEALNIIITEDEKDTIVNYLTIENRIEKIKKLLYTAEYRERWRQVYGKSQYSRMEEKLAHLDDSKTLRVFNEASDNDKLLILRQSQYKIYFDKSDEDVANMKTEAELRAPIPGADLKGIREYTTYQKELQELELQLGINMLDDAKGFTKEQIYLMCLSFLVCVVGITNAMLMSITERFREIATLKCLGATDSFILIQIVLEAMIQGVIGGLIGLLLGFIVALCSSLFQVGGRIFASFDWGMIGFAALFSLLAGVLLSVLSSLYPSAKAARMAPMEAMRVE